MRITRMFPARSGCDPTILNLERPRFDYPSILAAAVNLLGGQHINDVLASSYAALIVDEYQDCTRPQHTLLTHVADVLDSSILGDPMQAIFGFGGNQLTPWDDVCSHFPIIGELRVPWRWNNANAGPLGLWLLEVRSALLRGEPIDLRTAPAAVAWVELDGKDDRRKQLGAASIRPNGADGKVLVIGDSTNPDGQRRFASQIPGAVTAEAVDLRDLVDFARSFDLAKASALQEVVEFAQRVMTNVGAADLLQRVESLKRGTARKAPTEVEAVALTFVNTPSYAGAADLLVEINKQAAVRAHRPTILRAAIKALQLCQGQDGTGLHAAAVQMREDGRRVGRPLSRCTVGSTLLLKGLEADIVVILDADQLDARNLYVAMTRGATRLVICSRSPVLQPRP
jgi:superfamily I DNA/RNA helicase